jgi:hypothetical protein
MISELGVGQVIGNLTVIEIVRKVKRTYYICKCDCGETVEKVEWTLSSDKYKKACKTCIRKSLPLYYTKTSYKAMKARCCNSSHMAFSKYSSLPTPICSRWLEDEPQGFINFIEDMGERPDGMTLDRIDPCLGYSKENCRWTSYEVQNFNISKKENNTSGRTGVYWNKNLSKWLAYIRLEGKSRHLGYFIDFEDAVKARESAELEVYGFIKE